MKRVITILMTLILVLSASIPALAGDVSVSSSESIYFTVVFKKDKLPSNAEELISELGGEVVSSVPEIGLVQVKAASSFAKDAIQKGEIVAVNPSLLMQLPEVTTIEADSSISTANAPLFDYYQWDIKRLTNDGATFAEHSGSHDIVVGIIDSGIDLNHPDLQANLLPGSKNFVPALGIYGVDLSETGDIYDVQDRNGHGSHVAGSIAANGMMLGVAPNMGYRAYRVFGAEGGAYSAWIMEAMVAAANDGVNVINMSLGGIYSKGGVYLHDPVTGERIRLGNEVAEYVAYKRAAKYAESKGVLIVSSAGNDGINASSKKNVTELANEKYGDLGYEFQGASVYAPADISNVVTVSATGPQDELALYSTYGSGYVDVAAPGGNYELYLQALAEGWFGEYLSQKLYIHEFAFSSVPKLIYTKNEAGYIVDYQYDYPSYSWYVGTSMASPKVSAIAALIFDENRGISPQKVRTILKQTAEDIGPEDNDPYFGHGLSTVYSIFK
jgi:lantibiotic leader peptide-processing serine protease